MSPVSLRVLVTQDRLYALKQNYSLYDLLLVRYTEKLETRSFQEADESAIYVKCFLWEQIIDLGSGIGVPMTLCKVESLPFSRGTQNSDFAVTTYKRWWPPPQSARFIYQQG